MRLMAPLLTAAALVVATPAFAEGFTFTDERCKTALSSGVICVASTEAKTVSEVIGNMTTFEKFVALNQDHLPSDIAPTSNLPVNTFYLTKVNS